MAVDLHQLSIIVPIFNGCEALRTCLGILERDAQDAEVILVDGGSSDGALELARGFAARHENARLLEVANHGWAHASNQGFAASSRQVLLTMNSDLFPSRAALVGLTERLLERLEVGAVGPEIFNPDGTRQWGFGTLYWPNWVRIKVPSRINILHGACLATRRDVLEHVGGFDENFFFYNEEYDWCWRAGSAGYRLEILPLRVVHLEGASSGARSPSIQVEQNRGSLYLLEKHFGGPLLEATRRFFQLLGWAGAHLDPRVSFRPAWAKIESLAKRAAYLETPYTLSNRGEVWFEPSAKGD